MPRRLPPGSCSPCTLTCTSALLTTSLIWLAGGCGPGAATPMPEPPSIINLATVGVPDYGTKPVVEAQPGNVEIQGYPGTAPANATVRVTNLDKTPSAYSTTAEAAGDFLITLPVDYGDELRFEFLVGAKRSAPSDGLFLRQGMTSFRIQPSPRFECVKLDPGFVLEFGAATSETLTITNSCTGGITLGALTLRRSLPDFVLPTSMPQSYPSGASASISVTYSPASAAAVEDTLFIPLTQAGTTIRYPVTLSAHP